jgi:hypothetical protein
VATEARRIDCASTRVVLEAARAIGLLLPLYNLEIDTLFKYIVSEILQTVFGTHAPAALFMASYGV